MRNYNAEVRPRAWRWAIGVLLLLLAAAIVFVSSYADAPLLAWTVVHRPPFREISDKISRWGDWPAHVALGLLLLAVASWRGWNAWRRIALVMLVACALAGVSGRVIKMAVARPRPSVRNEANWQRPDEPGRFHSFPSGHTALSAAFFGVLAFARPRLGVALMVIPLVIAAARMFSLAHYLSDVVGAFVLGLGCAWLALVWLRDNRRISEAEY